MGGDAIWNIGPNSAGGEASRNLDDDEERRALGQQAPAESHRRAARRTSPAWRASAEKPDFLAGMETASPVAR